MMLEMSVVQTTQTKLSAKEKIIKFCEMKRDRLEEAGVLFHRNKGMGAMYWIYRDSEVFANMYEETCEVIWSKITKSIWEMACFCVGLSDSTCPFCVMGNSRCYSGCHYAAVHGFCGGRRDSQYRGICEMFGKDVLKDYIFPVSWYRATWCYLEGKTIKYNINEEV